MKSEKGPPSVVLREFGCMCVYCESTQLFPNMWKPQARALISPYTSQLSAKGVTLPTLLQVLAYFHDMRTSFSINSLKHSPAVGQVAARLIFISVELQRDGLRRPFTISALETWLLCRCVDTVLLGYQAGGQVTDHIKCVRSKVPIRWADRNCRNHTIPVWHWLAVSLCSYIWTSCTMNLIFFEDEERYLLCPGSDIWLGVLRAVLGETFLNYGLCDEDHVTP